MTAKPDEMGQYPIIGKRNFKINLQDIKDNWKEDIDLTKVADKEEDYQPLKDADISIDAKTEDIFVNKTTATFNTF